MPQLNVHENSKSLWQPAAKMEKGADVTKLGYEETTLYRSAAMRLAYVAQDRVDLQFSSKELARSMQEPNQWDMAQLKRAVRYFKGQARLVQRFHQQPQPDRLEVFTDSDFAGCLKTRRSTTCVMAFHGQHLFRATSTTQAIVSLSSGESEFYAVVKGGSIALGIGSLMANGVRGLATYPLDRGLHSLSWYGR